MIVTLAVVVLSVSTLFVLKKQNETMTGYLDEAVALWEKEETDKTLQKIDELSRFWEKYYIRISFIIQNDKTESINNSIAKLKPLVACNNEEFYAECENIRLALKIMYDRQLPTLHSMI
jgi:hypothetical protein